MTTGTKVFLALFALIVGVLVVYYGIAAPGSNPPGAGTVAVGGPGDNKAREPNLNAATPGPKPSTERRTSPPPRDPAPTAPQMVQNPAATMPASATGNGGLLSEGLREATGARGAKDGLQVQPGGDQSHTVQNPYLPLIGLNSGNLKSPGDEGAKGDVEPVPQNSQPQQPQVKPVPDAQVGSNPAPATRPAHAEPQPMEPMPERNPAPAPPPSKPVAAAPIRTAYVIAQGDTFVSIAEQWFGDANKWSLIARENPTVDPQKLKIGQKIFLPPKEAAIASVTPEPVVEAGETIYLVQSGDTLIAIARDQLGDGARWESIYDLNKATIGPDSAALKVGMKIKLPKK